MVFHFRFREEYERSASRGLFAETTQDQYALTNDNRGADKAWVETIKLYHIRLLAAAASPSQALGDRGEASCAGLAP